MLKSKDELIKFLEKKCENIAFDNALCEKIREYLLEKYDIPAGITMDMIARNILADKNEFILFCLVDGIDIATSSNYKKKFYTELEHGTYLKNKMSIEKIQFPIQIKCFQVANDQWIGACDSKFFATLRKEQLIKYNANAQRVMKRIIRGEDILFKIVPNKLAIRAIRALMKRKLYIPTTITLNIPYDSDAVFYYNDKENELVIESIEHFDIADGYHRYLAMSELSDSDPVFNYPMEIRIINFTEEKTRQFIFQEDQKTKMTQSASKTMNTNRASNNVVDRLNEMSTFDFKGQIGRSEGTVNYAAMSDLIEFFYFKSEKTYNNADIRNVVNIIKEKFNALSEYDQDYITRILDFKELAIIFYVFETETDLNTAVKVIDKALKENITQQIKQQKISKSLFNSISKLI